VADEKYATDMLLNQALNDLFKIIAQAFEFIFPGKLPFRFRKDITYKIGELLLK
jgi:hypothetical protein